MTSLTIVAPLFICRLCAPLSAIAFAVTVAIAYAIAIAIANAIAIAIVFAVLIFQCLC